VRDAAIYCRISSDPRGLALGVARQEEDCRKAAESLKWRVSGVYVDNDVSAFTGRRRPEYERMLDDIKAGRVNAVVVWDLDRLTRRPIELETFMEIAERYDVALKNIGGDTDLSTRQGRMMARIKGAVARESSEATRDRVKRANEQIAATGKIPPGGRRPFGYQRGGMTINEDEAATVRELARRILAGEGCNALANDLNRRGIVTSSAGRQWTHSLVKRLMTSPRIAGLRVLLGQIVAEGEWPAILTRDTWEAVQAELGGRAPAEKPVARPTRYLLTGIAVCGRDGCGSPVGIRRIHGKPRYACTRHGCYGVVREMTAVDTFIKGAVLGRLADPRIRAVAAPVPGGVGEELMALEARRRQIIAELGDNDALSVELAKAAVTRIDDRLRGLRARAAAARTAHVLDGMHGLTAADWDALPLDRRRAIVRALFEITLLPAGRNTRVFKPESIGLVRRSLLPVADRADTGGALPDVDADLQSPTD
jgi:site-specific DNA recombinase